MALGTILATPFDDIIRNKEYTLASGANGVLDHWKTDLVVALAAMLSLGVATILILLYELQQKPMKFHVMIAFYDLLTLGAWIYSLRTTNALISETAVIPGDLR